MFHSNYMPIISRNLECKILCQVYYGNNFVTSFLSNVCPLLTHCAPASSDGQHWPRVGGAHVGLHRTDTLLTPAHHNTHSVLSRGVMCWIQGHQVSLYYLLAVQFLKKLTWDLILKKKSQVVPWWPIVLTNFLQATTNKYFGLHITRNCIGRN